MLAKNYKNNIVSKELVKKKSSVYICLSAFRLEWQRCMVDAQAVWYFRHSVLWLGMRLSHKMLLEFTSVSNDIW